MITQICAGCDIELELNSKNFRVYKSGVFAKKCNVCRNMAKNQSRINLKNNKFIQARDKFLY